MKIPGGYLAALATLLLAATGLRAGISHFKVMLVKKEIQAPGGRTLTSLPRETAHWVQVGSDHRETEEVEVTLGTKNYVTRVYVERGPDGKPREGGAVLQFHAAYYTGMIDTVPHVPDRCFVGGGMQLGKVIGNLPMPLDTTWWRADEDAPEAERGHLYRVRASDGTYPHLPRDPDSIRLRTMEFLDGDRTLYAGYFFVANGGTTPLAEGVRLLAFDLRSEYAYYMKVQVTSDQVKSGEALAAQAGSLIGELLPDLMRCVPDWTEVEAGRYPPRAGGVGKDR